MTSLGSFIQRVIHPLHLPMIAVLSIFLWVNTPTASAETHELRIAQQYGVGYLPLMMMREYGLIKKYAAAEGIKDLTISWKTFTGGADMNTALLAGRLDIAANGVGPLLKIWDKSKGIYDIHAIAAINSMPLFLNTTNPNIHKVTDFTDKDRIALPAVKVSIQAVTLEMAVAKALGADKYDALDKYTVSMSHPDAMVAMLSGKSNIDSHLTSPPFQYQELEDPKVHTVLNSYDVLGGTTTFNVIEASEKFRKENPKIYKAVLEALNDAMHRINSDKANAARVYIKQSDSHLSEKFILSVLNKPGIEFTMFPERVMEYAKFLYKVKQISNLPTSVKDVFFPEVFAYQK